ncbi:anti-repressor SinI family protein [Priestia megaterium]|uniref:anti-repressor SinI family protein n=1 Tax=Priestia megaterium TaxID=1404 RepID=UPI00211D492C|nr:anti-repressor SinI family protein [Priestia megaterium]
MPKNRKKKTLSISKKEERRRIINFKDENTLDLEWVMLIMEAKQTGISIEEVRQFLQSISSNA